MRTTRPAPDLNWALSLRLPPDAAQEVFCLYAQEEPFLSVVVDENRLVARLTAKVSGNPYYGEGEGLVFHVETACRPKTVTLAWLGYALRLFADGELVDEEWPLGALPMGEWTVCSADGVEHAFEAVDDSEAEKEKTFTGPMQYFLPPGHNTGVGDCMPFARDGRYCLYYLFDRRGHKSKAGLGAHQWAQISSDDLKTWTIHPMAVSIDEQWEGSICTGSLIQKDGDTYAFYAVRMSDGSPAKISCAVSKDGVHFQKTGKYFALTAPYEPVSARDPMVFLGADGMYHMLVTTSIYDQEDLNGCLAHLTSSDLESWTQHGPFIVPGYQDQPECSDYFEWNGWYYLVFSNYAVARYRMSKSPFGPFIKPAYDILDTVDNQVVKTAAYKDRRLMTGFLAHYPRTYAGYAVTHELIQREDGTLGVKFVEEILPAFSQALTKDETCARSDEGRANTLLYEGKEGFRLRGMFSLSDTCTEGGLSIQLGNKPYRLHFDRAGGTVRLIRPERTFDLGETRLLLTGVNLDGAVALDLIMKDDIFDLVIGDERALTVRLGDSLDDGFALSVYVRCGAACLRELEVFTLH